MNARPTAGQLGVLDLMAIGVAALIVVLEAGLWLWAGTAGVLFGSGWPRLTPGALPDAIGGVAGHLADPRQGFPASVLPHACAARSRLRPRGRGRDHAPSASSRDRVRRPQAPRRPLGRGGRPGSPTSHQLYAPGDKATRCHRTGIGRWDGAWAGAWLPGHAAAARGGSPRARCVRADTVGEVCGARDPEHPRMGGASGRRVDQARPPRRDVDRPLAPRPGAGVRPTESME